MQWKMLLPTLVMFVALRGAAGQFAGAQPPPPAPPPPPPPHTYNPYPDPPTDAPEPDMTTTWYDDTWFNDTDYDYNDTDSDYNPQPSYNPDVAAVCGVDIVFLVDESSSISSFWFNRMKQFIEDFLQCFTPLHDIDIAVIPYHCVPRVYVPLHLPIDAIFNTDLARMMQKGGLSRTGRAIRFMKDTTYFRGDGVARAAVVMTDGLTDGPVQVQDDYAEQAAEARDAGIQLYAVSVGDEVDDAALQAIAGSSDRVFDSDIPCKVAFRILADLCKLAGVPGCFSYFHGAMLPLGSSIMVRDDSLGLGCGTSCSCTDDGYFSCQGKGCGQVYYQPRCQNFVTIPSRYLCCPVCADPIHGGVPDGCVHEDGSLIPVGDTYELDDCTSCTCLATGEEPQCESMACIALHCANPVKIVGQCCPVCVGCLYGDVLIPVDGTYEPDPCTSCTCDTLGGEPQCAVRDCPPMLCNNAVYVPGYCCPVCPDLGCPHEDGLILTGTAYQPDPCTNCTCPIGGMAPMCEETICPFNMYTLCPHAPGFPPALPVPVAGQCCGDCDAPPGCWYEEDNILIPMGTDYMPFSNPCTFWSCFEAGGEPMQAIMDCTPPDPACPEYVYIAGECCPVCQTDL
ncbi:uncharacterized protein LOC144870269 [Branchiostoma floridae x Branchiostoma japonicum]